MDLSNPYAILQMGTVVHLFPVMDSGVVNNTNRTRELVDLMAKISADREIVFNVADAKKLKDTGFGIDNATVNGYFDGEGITLNINSSKALNTIVGHEITHALEGTEFYDALKDTVLQYAQDTGDYNSRMAALRKIYSGKEGYTSDFENKLNKELVADLIGDYVFTDTDFINNLSTKNRNLFQKLYDEIKYLAKIATAGSKEARELEKIKKRFAEAYRKTKNTAQPDGAKYSVSLRNVIGTDDTISLTQSEAAEGELTASFIDDVNNMTNKSIRSKRKKKIGIMSSKHVQLINGLMQKIDPDFSAEGYELWMDGTGASHIEDRHGDSGKADTTMATKEAKILIPWAAQNADSAEFILDNKGNIKLSNRFDNSDNTKAPEIRLQKDINGSTLYVSECVPDSANKRIWITSAYIEKGSTGQLLNMEEESSPQPTSKTFFDGNATKNILANETENVNNKLSLSEDAGGNVPTGENIYGADVAVEKDMSGYTQWERELFGVLDSIHNGTDQQPSTETSAPATEQPERIRTMKE